MSTPVESRKAGNPVKRITIRDVARAAEVSMTTVSDSLTGKGRLPEETRRRVLFEAERLGYKASSNAVNLRAGRTGLLLLSVSAPNADDTTSWNIEFFVRVMSSASEFAFTHGYALAMVPLSPTDYSTRVPCDGVIVVDPVADEILVQRALRENLPLVTIGRLDGVPASVDNDLRASVVQVLEHLRDNGAKRPALLISTTDASYAADAASAYTAWCSQHGITPIISAIPSGPSEESAREATTELLGRDDAPDAILASLDSLAKGALTATLGNGLRVPEDFLIASIADSRSIAGAATPITALDLKPEELGAAAAGMLIGMIERSAEPVDPVIVPATLNIRASSLRG